MKFALHFANVTFPDGADALRLARLAEQFGFEALICPEHVAIPSNYQSEYPYSPTGRLPGGRDINMPDPLIWQAFAAGATTKLRFITGVLVLPQRNPLVLAKEVATLHHMSGGRLSLGIGVGWLAEEFAALGVPFERRGKRADEYIGAMRALWAGEDASFSGEFVNFTSMNCVPRPVGGEVPILVGGHTPFAARRAGRLGDGYFPATGSQVEIWPLVEQAREEAARAGKDPDAFEITMGCPEALPGSGADPLEAVSRLAAGGVHRVALPLPPFLPDLESALGRFEQDVMAHFR